MPQLVRAVADEGYAMPTPVQSEAIPHVLAGRDVLAGAQTGTGKTAAFVLPILQMLNSAGPGFEPGAPRRQPRKRIRVLVLTPTRELALQVEASIRTYGVHRPVRSIAIYGGVSLEPQLRGLRSGPEIVVATPGRLLDHVGQRTIDLSQVEILVLDEADRMLDMGFIHDIRRILALLPGRRQNLLFSATFSRQIRALAEGILHEPVSVQVTERNSAPDLVSQAVIPVDRTRKRELLSHLVRSGDIGQALVFTRTKHGANRLAEQLGRDGIRAAAIHGNKSQSQRVRALADFKRGGVGVLVATDIAARGIDIEALPHVVNFELPDVAADYVHRIGRTGRAGLDGRAVSLVSGEEAHLLRDIEALLRRRLPTQVVPGFEPDPGLRPASLGQRSGTVGRGATGRGEIGSHRRERHGEPSPMAQVRPSQERHRGVGIGRSAIALPGERLSRARPASPTRRPHGAVPTRERRVS